jgi:poly-beta-1,6 N-acetyl-D-glucosamine synthase
VDILLIVFLGLLVAGLFRVFSLWFLSISYSFRTRPTESSTERISVIVPAYNEEKTIASSIESLLAQEYPNFEVVLVDDGSKDRTLEIARGYEGPKLKVVHQENKGKAEALNTGIRASTGTLVLTVDADTRLGKGALQALVDGFAGDPKLGALSGNVRVDAPKGLLQRLQQVEYASGIGLTRRGQSMLSTVMIVPGPIAAFRREAVERAGLFSPQTFAEDFDITLAILKCGYRVRYEDRAVAYTVAPRGVEDLLKQRRRWYRGMTQVLAKYEGMFFRAKYGVAGVYGIPYMWYDTVSPIINLLMALFGVLAGLVTGDWTPVLFGLVAYWLLQTGVAISAIALDRERRLWEVALAPLLIFYGTFLDGIRAAAFVEELLTLGMKWETPAR